MLEYFAYLEETYLVRRLQRFADSPKARLSFPKKVYACDIGLVSSVAVRDGANVGHRLENLVYMKLLSADGELSYFMDEEKGAECDFLLERHDGTFVAVQVAWELSDGNSANSAREIEGMARAMERFGLKEGTIVTHSRRDVVNCGGRIVNVVPAYEWLLSPLCA